MAFIDNYQREDYRATAFEVADGIHKVRINEVKQTQAKTQKKMLEIKLDVKDSNGIKYIERIVESDTFNKVMARFFDAFELTDGNFNLDTWKNKTANAYFEHQSETFTNKEGKEITVYKSKLKMFLVGDEKPNPAPAPGPDTETKINNDDIPW